MKTAQFELAPVQEIIEKTVDTSANDPIDEEKVAQKRKKSFIDGKAFDIIFNSFIF